MSLPKRLSVLIGLSVVLAPVSAAVMPTSAFGALGTQLMSFVPQANYEGRGLIISGSTALVSTEDSTTLYEINLVTHETAGQLQTTGEPNGFGALAFDQGGNLWASEYTEGTGEDWIDTISGSGQVTRRFDAAKEINSVNQNIDGLAFATDGTMWLKGEGEGKASTTLYTVNSALTESNPALTVQFGNSGIAIDAEHHLWLADIDGHEIHEYDESGKSIAEFPTGTAPADENKPVYPEGLALDHCTFPGKLALWTFGADGVSSPLVAYEIGPYSGSTTDCPPPPKKEEQKKEETKPTPSPPPSAQGPSAPKGSASGGGGALVAGGSVLLQAADPADPTGTLFVYIWSFGDGAGVTGHGSISHTYKCAGVYRLSVTDIDTSGARHTSTSTLAVGFSRNDNKSYRGIHVSPHVRVSGHKATLWLSWSGKGKHVSARSIDWKLDSQRGKRFSIHIHAIGKVALKRDHHMTATARFSNGHSTTIRACFYA